MDAQITPDLGRGRYRSPARPVSSSGSDSSHSIASSTETLYTHLDDPVPGTSKLGVKSMDDEPCPLFAFQNPEDVQEHHRNGETTAFTAEEHQAAQARVDAAQLDPWCQERAITNIIKLDRNLKVTEEVLDGAQNTDNENEARKRCKAATNLTLANQAAAEKALIAAENRLNNIATNSEHLFHGTEGAGASHNEHRNMNATSTCPGASLEEMRARVDQIQVSHNTLTDTAAKLKVTRETLKHNAEDLYTNARQLLEQFEEDKATSDRLARDRMAMV